MRCVIEMGVYLSRTGSTLNVIWVLGGLGLILKIEGGGGRMTCIMAACVYLSWTGNRPRPVCHIHAPYPSSSARPAHPCLGYCASSPPPSPPSWNQTDKNLNCRPPTSRLCPVCHIHVPYPSSPARPPHPCIGSRAPPSPTSPPAYAQVTQT